MGMLIAQQGNGFPFFSQTTYYSLEVKANYKQLRGHNNRCTNSGHSKVFREDTYLVMLAVTL